MKVANAMAATLGLWSTDVDANQPNRKSGFSPQDAAHTVSAGLRTIAAAATSTGRASDPAALQSAARKLANASALLSSCDCLEDAMAELQKHRSKETTDQMRSAEGNVRDGLATRDRLRKQELELIEKRKEAEKKKSFWGSVFSVFSKILKAVAGVAKLAQAIAAVSPLGLLSAGISLANVALKDQMNKAMGDLAFVSNMGCDAASNGLSLSADCGSGGATSLYGVDAAQGTVDGVAQGIGTAVGRGYQGDIYDLEADAVDVRAERKRAQHRVEDEQEIMREVAAAQGKVTKLITSILQSKDRATKSAIRNGGLR